MKTILILLTGLFLIIQPKKEKTISDYFNNWDGML